MKKGDALSLPKGWEMKTLGEIGKVSMCKRILKKQTNEIGGIPFYKIGTFGKKANAYISQEIYNEFKSKYSFPKKGDILLSASGTIGRRVIYDGKPAYFQDSNIVWIDNDEKEVLNEYLYKFYGYCDWNPSRGATISRLYNDDLRRIQIPIPPLHEQKQIVAIFDKAFAAIDQAKANIEKNIENAKELFQSKLNEIFSQRGEGDALSLPKGWEEKTLGEVTSKIGSGATPRGGQKSYKEEGTSLIRSLNVYDDGFRPEKLAFIDEEQAEKLKNVTIEEGDVLLNITGASVARCCIAPKEYLPARVNQHVSIIRIKNEAILPSFLHLSLTSKANKDKLLGIGDQGATRQAITKTQIQKFKIKFPEIETQKKIVNQLNQMKVETGKLESHYHQKLANLEDLKKSILQKAFSGELTSPEGTQYEKEVRSASDKKGTKHSKEVRSASEGIMNKKSPERAI
ncbi:restriction endonuclease subunit S [Zobellia galactanivorans]|uniref:restriction endonuclease subunit S n=1 Tax=Zobellia galactanivorans (strain DSM 12802 / CCUG 47099 / CIP 106680 / NCIMB 13871 / Dsij) TaxID=63186 RepID=UPI0026E21D0F|nr:restriction endonuclease subunit S [Zobellia galactanivorans]MDO6809091.1 restriction endonuclease subunit S [Zobellia galactanivorans]